MAGREEDDIGGKPYVNLLVKMSKEEHRQLKKLCVELGLSMQEFIRRMLAGSLPIVEKDPGKGI